MDINKVLSFFGPQVFKTVYASIQKAGDQGLSIKEVSQVTDIQGIYTIVSFHGNVHK